MKEEGGYFGVVAFLGEGEGSFAVVSGGGDVGAVGDQDFDDFEIASMTRDAAQVVAIVVGPAEDAPLVFSRPGTYPDPRRPSTHQSRGSFAARTFATGHKASRVRVTIFETS